MSERTTIRQHKPVVYQEIEGGRREVEGRYALRSGGRVGFEVGEYDPSAALIIDPVLAYSTYLGGSGDDTGTGIAVDSAGNAYVTGFTASTNFPTANALQSTFGGGPADAFVTKLNASGSALVYSTYLGGTGDDGGHGIALDSAANAYVTGATNSNNFPTANALQSTFGGTYDAFVTKLNPAGSALVYSTYLGGSGDDGGHDIAVDSAGNAYVTGYTLSTDFPTANAFQRTIAGAYDAFVTKIGEASRLLNIATRLRVQSGENVLIGGFIITGTDPKKVIIRGIGPSLAQFFSGALADPTLELFQGNTLLASNNDWKENEAEVAATGIPPSNDLESAIVRTLPPGNYTAIVRGNGDATGIGVVEAYDLDQAANSKFANIATRGFVDTDDNVMIGGLIVGPSGGASAKVVVRALGPSVPVSGPLGDPTLELHDVNGTTIATNDNWKIDDQTGQSQEAAIRATTIPPPNDLESALIATLAPGNYTAIVRGKNNTTGVGLVEVYNLQ